MGLLELLIIILVVMWILGFGIWGATIGPLVHLLLVIAVIVLIIRLIRGSTVV